MATTAITEETPIRMPSTVRNERSLFARSDASAMRDGFREGHGQLPRRAACARRFSILPSRMRMVRWACSAMSRSWVTRMMVLPSLVQPLEEPHDLLAGRRVEVAGGLVGEQDRRAASPARGRWPRAGAGRPRARSACGSCASPRSTISRARLRAAARRSSLGTPGVDERQLDVVERGRPRQQVEGLEDEADLAVAHRGQLVVVHLRDDLAAQHVGAPARACRGSRSRFMSVDLPEPEGPMIATYSPALDRRS